MMGSYCLLLATLVVVVLPGAFAEYCNGYGHSCNRPLECCGNTCCRDKYSYSTMSLSVWNMWYFWFIVILIMMTCFGSCGYWRRRQMMLAQQQQQARTLAGQPYSTQYTTTHGPARGPVACHTTTLGVYPNYNYPGVQEGMPQTQGAFPAPPPYIEVVSKPDVYPASGFLPPYQRDPMPYPTQQTGGFVPQGPVLPPTPYPTSQMPLSMMTPPSSQPAPQGTGYQRPPAGAPTNAADATTRENTTYSNSAFVHPEEVRGQESVEI